LGEVGRLSLVSDEVQEKEGAERAGSGRGKDSWVGQMGGWLLINTKGRSLVGTASTRQWMV